MPRSPRTCCVTAAALMLALLLAAGCESQPSTPPAAGGNAGGQAAGGQSAVDAMAPQRGMVPDISAMRDAVQNMAAMRGGLGGSGADAAILDDESGPYAAGKKVFKAQGCTRCHSVSAAAARGGFGPMAGPPGFGGPGGFPGGRGAPGAEAAPPEEGQPEGNAPGAGPPGGARRGMGGRGGMMGMGRGPNLSKVGADPEHTVEWLGAHIRDPKTHNPQSRMPAYEGKISDEDLSALAAFLASLTGDEPDANEAEETK